MLISLQRIGIVPKNQLTYSKITRYFNLALLYPRIQNLEGCIVECGVAQGGTLAALKVLSIAENKERPIYGFDTFAGLPDGSAAFCHSKGEVIQYFKDNRVPMENVTLVEGDVRYTLKNFNESIAFLHIDLDLYEGYNASLNFLWDNVVSGGVVVFDDYNERKWKGATMAVDEFVKEHELTLHCANFAKKYYLIK